MTEFRMPSLGSDMEAGTLVEWLKKPGDALKRGDIVAVVETQKGAIEIEIFEEGVLERYLVELGAEVPVGAPLAMIRTPGTTPSENRAPAMAPPLPTPPPTKPPPSPPGPKISTPAPSAARTRASPAARKLAGERRIDLATLQGGGPGGIVQLADVEAAVVASAATATQAAPPAMPRGFDFSQMRAAIAAAMARSKREIPHYYIAHSVDVGAASEWVSQRNAGRPPAERVLIGALFVKAAAAAAMEFPEFNGFFDGGAFRPSKAIHVGLAISIRGGGLVAPAIHDTSGLTLDALMAAMRDLVARVRAGRFRSSEIADPTITVSSLGERGVETLFGVIYPPQVAIVGFGKVETRPWVAGDVVAARPVVAITLAADHRVSDGHRGALFLGRIGQMLQTPEML